jgi:Arc-like DNA binding domain
MARKQSDTVQLKLRFPEKLRLRIETAAARNQRSMNLEIVHRLEQSFEKNDRDAEIRAVAEQTATAVVDKTFEIAQFGRKS